MPSPRRAARSRVVPMSDAWQAREWTPADTFSQSTGAGGLR